MYDGLNMGNTWLQGQPIMLTASASGSPAA